MRRVAGLLMAGLVAGCTTLGGGNGQAARPPATGGSIAATIIAAMNGGLVGGALGSDLSNDDRRLALEAEYRALEYTAAGQAVRWQGKDGSGGAVTPAQPYRVGSQDCRQYSHSVNAAGQTRSARGTACRNGDGSWTPLT